MEPCGFLSFHQNPASTSDLPLGPGAEVADGLWTCPATLKFGSFEPQLLLDRDMAREEERQQLAAYCRASLGPSLLGWSGLEIPTLQLLDESKRRRAMFLESECRNRQLQKQCDALNTKVQVLTDIKADQATELRRLSAKTTKLQQVAEQQSRSLEEAQANISALARELAASKQQLCLTQQSAAEGAEAAARANASLTEALASAQQQLVDSQEQAQQAAQAVEAAAYSTLVACRDRHYQQLAAQLSEHKAELQQQTGLAAAAAAADREAAAARAQEAASCIAELQAAVQVRAGQLHQTQLLAGVWQQQAEALQVVISVQAAEAGRARSWQEMHSQRQMHAASRHAASLRQELTARRTAAAASTCKPTPLPTAASFSQVRQYLPCQWRWAADRLRLRPVLSVLMAMHGGLCIPAALCGNVPGLSMLKFTRLERPRHE